MTSKYLNEEGIRILKDRFLTPKEREKLDKNNNIDDIYWKVVGRIVRFVSSAEEGNTDDRLLWTRKFTDIIGNQEFVPGGRFWANAGTDDPQLFNCDVVSPKDDLNDIYDKLKVWGISHSFGAGMGGNFGKLRHRGAPVKGNPNKKACGPVAAIKMYNAEAELNQQSGSRRAACMAILPFTHPDILDFVYNKNEGTDMSHFNQSVSMTYDIMNIIDTPERFGWAFRDSVGEYKLFIPNDREKENPTNNMDDFLRKYHKDRYLINSSEMNDERRVKDVQLSYIDIFNAIAENAWRCGDPGMMFIDTVNEANPLIEDYKDTENRWYFDSPNPCGEIYMADYEICMLGAINLAKLTHFSNSFNKNVISEERLKEVTKLAVRFLDDSIDVSSYPTEENKWASQQTRRIGLGIMGFADMLALMKIPYGSDRSYEIAEHLMKIINDAALDTSIELGKEKGNFPLFKVSAYYDGRNGFPLVKTLRNAFRTSIAPTGTIAALVGVNNGLEPFYALSYTQTDGLGKRDILIPFLEKHPEYNDLRETSDPVLVTAKELTY